MIPYKSSCRLTSPYGYRTDPLTGKGQVLHKGIDLVGSDKTVLCPIGGTVTISAFGSECGNQVGVKTDDGYTLFFCHLASRLVKKGDRIESGSAIGIEGATGKVTGVHLHFEVWKGDRLTGTLLNPADWLGIENKVGTYFPELITPNDIVYVLATYGIVTDVDGMIAEMQEKPDGRLYWLARKIVNYWRSNPIKAKISKPSIAFTEPFRITNLLHNYGIVSDNIGMIAEMREFPNGRLYWTARKALEFWAKGEF